MNKLVLFMSAALLMTSCVPKKKYVALEKKYNTTK
ncbi:MAG TPA: cell envelope biogenesis protein OmpA, partial [Tenacibaculum sp.]|nr:cell envelope biogenesis protein OmpA [Tenacibaculum sp.]